MARIPDGKTVRDLLPTYSASLCELVIGAHPTQCASCRKPFTAVRKPRRTVKIYPVAALVPVVFLHEICGACLVQYQRGGNDRDGVLAAVQAFLEGDEANQ